MKKILLFILLFMSCGITINAQPTHSYYYSTFNGTLGSNGENLYYENNLSDLYHILPDGAAHVKLVLHISEVGNYPSRDNIYVYDGYVDYSPLIGIYNTDNPAPDTIVSTGNCLEIIFETDNIDNGELGWSADYFGVKPLPTIYSSASGTFNDGITPTIDCVNQQLKTYLIKPSGASKVELSFPEYSIESAETFMWVYDGVSENAPLISTQVSLPATIQSTGNSLFIKYLINLDCSHWTAQYSGIYESVAFTYDASGNRTNRNFISLKSAKANPSDLAKQPNIKQPDKKPYKDKSGNADITIYPNPTSGELKVEIANFDFTQQSAIYVFDPLGKLIIQKSPATGLDVIDLSNYANGLYVMKIKLGDKGSEWKILKE